MTAYHVQDIPSEDLVVVPTRAGNIIGLDAFNEVDVTLYDGAGLEVETLGFIATIDVDEVTIEWPSTTVFETPGLYALAITLSGAGVQETADDLDVVVEARDGWHSIASVRAQVETGMSESDAVIFTLLESAKLSVLTYAEELEENQRPPLNYKQAELMQVRNIFNSSKTDPAQSQDGELFVIRPYPLDNVIKQLLRPRTVIGGIA